MSATADLSAPTTHETDRDRPTPRRSWSLIALLTRLHFYTGILVAPFLVMASVTGLLFAFTPQLDNLVYHTQLHAAQIGPGLPHPLSVQVAAARAVHPDGTLASVLPAATPDATTRVVFALPQLGEKQHTVYIDPYTTQVRGTLTTWFDETPLTTWLDDLHRNLHLYTVGRVYSELAASWLWVLVVGGLILWLHRQWRTRRRIRAIVMPDLTAAKGVRRTRGWHAATGVWLAIGLLFLSATGLTWSRWAGAQFSAALDTLHAHSPALDTRLSDGAIPARASGGHHSMPGMATDTASTDPANIDAVLHTALGAGVTGPMSIGVPAKAGAAWTVTQIDRSWPVHLDAIAIDPANGAVTARSHFADWPLPAQLSKLGVQAHMGYLFGLPNQLLLTALGSGLLCVIVWGYRMWWQRRPTRTDRRAPLGTPPARGAWPRLRWPLLAVGVIATAAVGWALPEFGVTLTGFLAVDVATGLIQRRRRSSTPTAPAPAGAGI
jgi:uncharacterized iron-regulated membrane protein